MSYPPLGYHGCYSPHYFRRRLDRGLYVEDGKHFVPPRERARSYWTVAPLVLYWVTNQLRYLGWVARRHRSLYWEKKAAPQRRFAMGHYMGSTKGHHVVARPPYQKQRGRAAWCWGLDLYRWSWPLASSG